MQVEVERAPYFAAPEPAISGQWINRGFKLTRFPGTHCPAGDSPPNQIVQNLEIELGMSLNADYPITQGKRLNRRPIRCQQDLGARRGLDDMVPVHLNQSGRLIPITANTRTRPQVRGPHLPPGGVALRFAAQCIGQDLMPKTDTTNPYLPVDRARDRAIQALDPGFMLVGGGRTSRDHDRLDGVKLGDRIGITDIELAPTLAGGREQILKQISVVAKAGLRAFSRVSGYPYLDPFLNQHLSIGSMTMLDSFQIAKKGPRCSS